MISRDIVELQEECVLNLIKTTERKNIITFKSPTGSGKTYMMADFMNRILEKDNNIIFLVSCLSKGNLAKQNCEKFEQYIEEKKFNNLKPYLISSNTTTEGDLVIPEDNNIYVLPTLLYRDKGKLMRGGLFRFLHRIKAIHNKKIYLIKDESHIKTSKLDELSSFFDKTINFSATPKKEWGQIPDVIMDEHKAINAKLIKKIDYRDDNDYEVAFNHLEKIKKDYNNLLGINPCLIIQISNKEKADEEITEIKKSLSENHPTLKWMLIVDDDKNSSKCDTNDILKIKGMPPSKWADYAKQDNAIIDIIIFKLKITEGWDIPRACMLFQTRDSKSKQLDEQVIGRVRRNPKLNNFNKLSEKAQELAMQAWVWGIVPEEAKVIKEVKLIDESQVQKEIKIKTTRLKDLPKSGFNIYSYMKSTLSESSTIPLNIFDLYKKYETSSEEVQDLYNEYVNDINKWINFITNIDDINKKSKEAICDYSKTMEIVTDEFGKEIEVSFPLISYYTDNQNYKDINDWLWKKTSNPEDDEFSFDSEAEKEWAKILTQLSHKKSSSGEIVKSIKDTEKEERYLWGKNYLINSQIKFEYYLNGKHASYPDFIMKDNFDRIHIFEVKSLNQSNKIDIDKKEYEEKIRELKLCYKQASKLTGYYFYLPIQKDSNWFIWYYENGEEKYFSSREDFEVFMKTKP